MRNITAEYVRGVLPARPANAHKGVFGRLLVVAGSSRYPGSACLATLAALRSGVGIATLAAPRGVTSGCIGRLLEPTYLPLPETPDGGVAAEALPLLLAEMPKCSAVLLGCGLGQGEGAAAVVEGLLANCTLPLVLDADGINLAARRISMLERTPARLVLTPHRMELARLLGRPLAEATDGAGVALAARLGATVVVKSEATVVARRDGGVLRLENAANPGLAKGGSGDVLAGILAALCAEGTDVDAASAAAVYVHSRAGYAALAAYGAVSMLPGDLLDSLPAAWREVSEG